MAIDHHGRLEFSNQHIQLSIDLDDFSGSIARTVGNDQRWGFAPLQHLSQHQRDSSKWTLESSSESSHLGGGATGTITNGLTKYHISVLLEVSEPELVFEIVPLDGASQEAELPFPGPLVPTGVSVTELALPTMLTNGVLHRPSPEDQWTHACNVASHSGLSMPFWGLGTSTQGLLAILETPDDVSLVITKRSGESIKVEPVWMPSLGSLRYGRTLRCRLIDQVGYSAVAKAYRAYVVAQGRFKSLREKVAERPIVEQVVGGPYFSTGYLPFSERKFQQVTRGLREIGYTNGLIGPVTNIQWDSGRWLNDYQAFVHAPKFSEIARREGFAAFAWLYLEDILTWDSYFDPSALVRGPDGKLLEGWFNNDYEYYLICSKVLRESHSRLQGEMTKYDALHFDTTTAKALTECWDAKHRMSKTEDREARRARLEEVASWGMLIGSEAGYDWAFDVYDFCSSNPRRAMETGLPVKAHHIPLMGLVYHDAVVSYCWEYDPYNTSYFGGTWGKDKLLHDAMAGNPPTVAPVMGYFPVIKRPPPPIESRWVTWEDPETQQLLRDALPVAELHQRTAYQQMITHDFIDDDFTLSRTVYADGTTVFVNFGETDAQVDSGCQVVAGRSFAVD